MSRYPKGSTVETREGADATPDKPEAVKKSAPRIRAIIERRLQNPFGEGSQAIELKDKDMTVHVINTAVRPGRYHDVTRTKGWEPVLPEDLVGDATDYGFDIKDGRVVRGERGTEVLMKMPTKDVQAIQMAKDAANRKKTSPRALKNEVVGLTAAAHGDQSGEYIDRMTTIKDERAPVPLEEEAPS